MNQEEQSADRTLRGNKRGADYLQSLLSGKLMLNQFDKMHLFRQAGASRGNVWSLAKMCFLSYSSRQRSVFVTRFAPLQANAPQSSIKKNSRTVDIADFEDSLKSARVEVSSAAT